MLSAPGALLALVLLRALTTTLVWNLIEEWPSLIGYLSKYVGLKPGEEGVEDVGEKCWTDA